MTRPSLTWGALLLAGLASAVWIGSSHHNAQAAPLPAPGAMTIPGTGNDSSLTTLGTASTAASDGQGSVVLTYPNGIIAVLKPATMDSNELGPRLRTPIAIYRLHTNGMTERISMAPPPAGH